MTFRLATYNVLAAAYAVRRLYPHTPAHLLDADYRRSILSRYLLGLDADILCLQEVERDTYAILSRDLSAAGFAGEFVQKTNGKPDGCATFAKSARVSWREHKFLAYSDAPADGAASGHIAQISVLRVDDMVLAVANTHLKWAPPAPEQQTALQVGARQISELIAARSVLCSDADAWIVSGDFNVTPDALVVSLLGSAGFRFTHESAVAPTCVANGEARMIDYVFYDAALSAAPLPIEPLTAETALPNAAQASDHVAVCAAFRRASGADVANAPATGDSRSPV